MNIGTSTSTENRLEDISSNRPNKSSVNFLINGLGPTSVGLGLSAQDLQLTSGDISADFRSRNNDIIRTPLENSQCTTPRVMGLETPQFQPQFQQSRSQSQFQLQSLPSLFSPREERDQRQQQQQRRMLSLSATPLTSITRNSQGQNYQQPFMMSTRIPQEPSFRLVTPSNDILTVQTSTYKLPSSGGATAGTGSGSSSDSNSLLDSQLVLNTNSSSPNNNYTNNSVITPAIKGGSGIVNNGNGVGSSYGTLTSQEYSMKPIFSPTSQRCTHSTSFGYNEVAPPLPLTPPVSTTPGSVAVFPSNLNYNPVTVSGSSGAVGASGVPSQPLQSLPVSQDQLPPILSSTVPVVVPSQPRQQRISPMYTDNTHRGDFFLQQQNRNISHNISSNNNNVQRLSIPVTTNSVSPSYSIQYDTQYQYPYQYQYQYQYQPPPFYTFHTIAKHPNTVQSSSSSTTSSLSTKRRTSKAGSYSRRKKINQCHICGKILTRASSLHSHMLVHTGDRPFMCTWPNCKKRFNVKSNMNRHYKLHLKRVEKEKLRQEEKENTSKEKKKSKKLV